MELELYKKHRPKRLKDVVGQDETIEALQTLIKKKKVPQAILLTGPTGVGKTTIGRIILAAVGCEEDAGDLTEINSSDFRGIDTVRDVRRSASKTALSGGAKGWIFDELHQMRSDAQDSMLKLLEDPPENVYFVLATTDPHKLRPALKGRCTTFGLNPISNATLNSLLRTILKKEKKKLHKKVQERIIEVANGSARNALVSMHKVLELDNWKKQLKAVKAEDVEAQAIELCRKLINLSPRSQWKEIGDMLKALDKSPNAEPETIRRMVLGYANAVLRNAPRHQAYLVIQCFRDHFYDTGAAGLTGSCYQVWLSATKAARK